MAIYNILWETPCKVSNQMKQVFMKKSLIWWTNWFNGFLLIYWRLNSFSIFVCYLLNPDTVIYIVHFDQYPPPLFLRFIFPPTNKFAEAGRSPAWSDGRGVWRGSEDPPPPAKFVQFTPRKDAFLKLSPLLPSPFSFFPITLHFLFFSQRPFSPPPQDSILHNIYPCPNIVCKKLLCKFSSTYLFLELRNIGLNNRYFVSKINGFCYNLGEHKI